MNILLFGRQETVRLKHIHMEKNERYICKYARPQAAGSGTKTERKKRLKYCDDENKCSDISKYPDANREKTGILIEERMVEPLLDWYAENARRLPWRENPQPYYVWISEIMLQQTRVEAVKDYFARFIRELPDIAALAQAEEERLLKLWEGLGYYSRARNLKKAAVVVMSEYGGCLPRTKEELLKLPGIGAYTAGAIASIAYEQKAAAVDGNVLRVMARLWGDGSDVTKENVRRDWAERLEAVMPEEFPGAFNQALMELGATVCLPNGKPLCGRCPLQELCTAHREDTWSRLPVKPDKKPRRVEERTVFLIETEEGFLVRKRPARGLLAGLWEYPAAEGKRSGEQVRELLEKNGIAGGDVTPLGEAKHIFSHIEWHMEGYYVKIRANRSEIEKMCFENRESYGIMSEAFLEKCIPVTWEQLNADYSVPSAFEAYRNAVGRLRAQRQPAEPEEAENCARPHEK